MRRQPYSWPPSPTGDHSTHGKPNDSGRRGRSGTRSRQPQRRARGDRGPRASRSRSASPSTASTRSRSGSRIRSPGSSTASTARCATSPSTSTRASSSASSGRNGSGKSTLLKILASIYRADAGRVRMAGRVAPFIELGVGFNPELTARENGVLNGVLMGLTLREARRRLDAVLEFAELEDFVDLKLKNYSSGMMVRFAFAVMVQADADIMLIDEVLAVGDAAFAQKCMDVFHERRRAGKTIVLVTHDMATVQTLCHRAMLLARRRAALHRRARGRGAALLPDELRRRRRPAGARDRRREGRRRQRAGRPRRAARRGRRAGRERSRRARRSCSTSCSRRRAAMRAAELHLPRPSTPTARRVRASRAARRARRGGAARAAGRADREPARRRALLARRLHPRGRTSRAAWPCRALRLLHFVVYGTRAAARHGLGASRRRAGAGGDAE